ncbi:MAG: radical SAM protein [Candidatus Firestonebacteria bacterium]|nr:radical SAM protein [Candidatus Firestonebacteria bacterium]
MKQYYIIPIFFPNAGCKERCIFCSQKNIIPSNTGKELDIEAQINEYMCTFPKKAHIEVAFYGGTFTELDLSYQEKLLKKITPFINKGQIQGIRISTRPDALNDDKIKLLESLNVKVVELGVQSLSDKVLRNAERGHTVNDVINATNSLKKRNIEIGFQMMVGLPGEDIYLLKKSIKLFIQLKPDFVRIHPTIVLKGSKLEKLYEEGKYEPLSLKQAINRSLLYFLAAEKEKIKVARIGLYNSKELQKPGIIVAGPYHPAFRELVEGEKYYRIITANLGKKIYNNSNLIIYAYSRSISKICGQHSCNINRLKKRYKFKFVKVIDNKEADSEENSLKLQITDIS